MGLFKRMAKKKLEKRIARHMGTLDRRPLEESSHPEIQELFHPHSLIGPKKGYPLYQMFHDFSKMPVTSIRNFVDLKKVEEILRRDKIISKLLRKHPSLEQEMEDTILSAVFERGVKASNYWKAAPKSYIDAIVKAAGEKPNPMNELVGRKVKALFGEKAKPRTIVDIGTFSGGTILKAIEQLSMEQRKVTKIYLVDVNEDVVNNHAVPALKRLGVPEKNIITILTGFYNASIEYKYIKKPFHERNSWKEKSSRKKFRELIDRADAVIGGAATINFAHDSEITLKTIKKMLKEGGQLILWEWGSPEVREKKVNIERMKKTVLYENPKGKITEFDAYASFLSFWMKFFNYPEIATEKLIQEINSSKEFDFLEWIEKKVDWLEKLRIESGKPRLADPAGYRNRAYRLGRELIEESKKQGLKVIEHSYPLAEPGKLSTGNVNYMIVVEK